MTERVHRSNAARPLRVIDSTTNMDLAVLRALLKLFRPQVGRIRWFIWFVATCVLVAWLVELIALQRTGFVGQWLVPFAFVALVGSFFLQPRFWLRSVPSYDTTTRIVVIGAGPAGLAAAYFLRQQGYREVLVLEKLGRVGGLCRTITEDYRSFDLGANYVTPAYSETLKLADEVGADLYVERPIITVDYRDQQKPPQFTKPWKAVREGTSGLRYIRLCLKYLWLRFRVGRIVNRPGHARIHEHPELCVPFLKWLERHKLEKLQRLFEAPITVMGYGYLDEVPAPYALKYMSIPTFAALALKAFPLTSWSPWPKRFILGFQRLWEAVAWRLNVRFNVTIHSISRTDGQIVVDFSHEEQVFNSIEPHRDKMTFDKLILACPLTLDVLHFLDLDDEEEEIFRKIKTYSYCLTSFTTQNVDMDRPIAAALPLPDIGKPWAITKQMQDSRLFQFYSRVPGEWLEEEEKQLAGKTYTEPPAERSCDAETKESDDYVRGKIVHEVRSLVNRLGGDVVDDQWHTYDRWPYFQHFETELILDGIYQRLENRQGVKNTFYAGAIMNFELVESCIAYSKALVRDHF